MFDPRDERDDRDETRIIGDPDATRDPDRRSETRPPGFRPGDPLPEKIGPYPILRALGHGGMGVVYVALDPSLEREIALKVLPEHFSGDAAVFERFRSEAKLLAAMNNPNIATIYSLNSDGAHHFLTMELIRGRDLATWLEESPRSLPDRLAVCRQVAVALEAAHKRGVVHLDLKPQNVMITDEGLAKVLDFGLALALGRASGEAEEARTQTGRLEGISGTPGYMSPEQIRGIEVDSRADVWAFGCVLYECMTGRAAFPGETIQERFRATLEAEADLDALPQDLPAGLRDLVRRCLERDPGERLESITKARRGIEEEIALLAVPAPRARTETIPNNLPAPMLRFVGRETVMEEIRGSLEAGRLVTLTGVGGGGKTRLSIETARSILNRYPDGVWFVELAPLASPDLVPGAVASALKLRDQPRMDSTSLLLEHFAARSALLILDNCEQVVAGVAAMTGALLAGCPYLTILATSREILNVSCETVYRVPSMALPAPGSDADPDAMADVESISLFVDRATAAQPSFRLDAQNAGPVAQICRRLDGIPLAIELAAARVKVLPVAEIAARLDSRFRLLTSTRRTELPRHQTLRALIDWSYDHLSETEQLLLRRLCLFAAGWTLDAAEAICGGDGIEDWEVLDLITNLVDKSLVEVDAESGRGTGKPRYRMLETIREYARDRLQERQEGPETFVRLREYFVLFAEQCDPQLVGPEQSTYLARLAADHENLRLAMDLCLSPEADPELGWRIAGALGRYFYLRGHWTEGRNTYAQLIARPEAPAESAAAANALNWAGNLAKLQGELAAARAYLGESLLIRRRLGDERGIAASLNNLANVLKDLGDHEQARRLYEESLELQRKTGNRPGVALALNALGVLSQTRGDYQTCIGFHTESLALRRELGDRAGIAASLNNLGVAFEKRGEIETASAYLRECLPILQELGDRFGMAAATTNLGRLAEMRGELSEARDLYERGLVIFRDLGDRTCIATALHSLGQVARLQGERDLSRRFLMEAVSIACGLGDRATTRALLALLARTERESENWMGAARLLAAADSQYRAPGSSVHPAQADPDPDLRAELTTRLGRDFESIHAGFAEMSADAAIDHALAEFRHQE